MNDPRASQNIPQPDEVSTSLLSLEYIMSRIPDKGIVFSRACEKVSLSVYAKYVRSALLPVGFVVLAYTVRYNSLIKLTIKHMVNRCLK